MLYNAGQTTYTGSGAVDTVTLYVFAQAVLDLGSSEILDLNGVQSGDGAPDVEYATQAAVIFPSGITPVYVEIDSSGSNASVAVRRGRYVSELNPATGLWRWVGTAKRTDVDPFYSASFAKAALTPLSIQALWDRFAGVRINYGGAADPASVDLIDTHGTVVASGTSSNTAAAPSRFFLTTRRYNIGGPPPFSVDYNIYH